MTTPVPFPPPGFDDLPVDEKAAFIRPASSVVKVVDAASDARFSPLDTVRIHESEEKEGERRRGRSVPPLLA